MGRSGPERDGEEFDEPELRGKIFRLVPYWLEGKEPTQEDLSDARLIAKLRGEGKLSKSICTLLDRIGEERSMD